MWFKFRATYDPALDTFRIEYLVGASALLALIWNYRFTPMEVCYLAAIDLADNRSSGPSRYTSNQLRFYPNFSCCQGQEKQQR